MQCTHGPPARLRCAPVPVPVSEMDRPWSWRHANRSSKKKASPAPRTAPGIVAVMASAEAVEDTAMPAGGCRLPPARPVAVAIPATQLAAPALHDDATPLPACLPRSKACAWRACRPPARHQHPAGRPLRADLTSLHLSIIHRGLHACAVVREQG